MENEKLRGLEASDLTLQDRWDILSQYITFSARIMTIEAFFKTGKERDNSVGAAAALCSIKQIMSSDKELIKCTIEMQDKFSDIIKAFPMSDEFKELEDL